MLLNRVFLESRFLPDIPVLFALFSLRVFVDHVGEDFTDDVVGLRDRLDIQI